jgi:uncharacterized protein (DUF1697 family)
VPPKRGRGIEDIPRLAPMARHIALLRGINVGSHNRLAMPALRELLAANGFEDPRTLLQSGNVVVSSRKRPDAVGRHLERLIAERFGMEIAVVVRSRDELAAVIDANPLAAVATEPKLYQVSFLSAAPDPSVIEALEAADLGPERIVVRGREIYAWYAGGIQRSLAAKLLTDAKLGVTATARNWNTVTKLLEMADAG